MSAGLSGSRNAKEIPRCARLSLVPHLQYARKLLFFRSESANLIQIEGRHVAKEGRHLEDHGTPGNLTAGESEKAIAADRATFVSFAQALHGVGTSMLDAADARNPQALLDAGGTLDHVCEGCHLKFWYPGQKIPTFPGQAPEPR